LSAFLEVIALEASYGKGRVLNGISLEIRAGELVGFLGRNGMGKTTSIRAMMGLLPPKGGEIRLRGERIDALPPHRIAAAGVSLVPEGRQIFPNLTVRENLIGFARHSAHGRWTLERVFMLFPRLAERARSMGSQLSGGEQQMLAIGRALMTNAELILIDEATEGLAPIVREEIWRCLRQLKEEGQALLVVDKYVERLLTIADRHYIIESGRVVWSGASAELARNRQVLERYLSV
jgi:branched-chain amino acid transport system ATP-binding protein